MTDIVKRLSAPDYWFSGSNEGHEGENDAPLKAATEITRLRNELHIAEVWSARIIAGTQQDVIEIARLRAEVERLNKSRNKWGQKYNKLLEQHKVTVSQLKTAVWSDSEECKLLTAENERLRAYALKAFTVVEFCSGQGFLLQYPTYDCDDLLMEGVELLKVETSEESRAIMEGK